MFYYYKMDDGKVEFVRQARNLSVEEFYKRKEGAERKDPSIKYEIVPIEMEPLARYCFVTGGNEVDFKEIYKQIEDIREALIKIEREIEGDE